MITIISSTNRKDSNTLKVAREYERLLNLRGQDVRLFNLEQVPHAVVRAGIFDEPDEEFDKVQQHYLIEADKFIFVLPEYNGSMPGILKLVIDVADIKPAFYGKKALLVGVATGRAGNLRGMDHMTGVLNHMKMSVHWNKLPISKVTDMLDADQRFKESTLKVVEKQIDDFITF